MFDKNFFPIRRQKLKIGCLKFSIYEGFNCYIVTLPIYIQLTFSECQKCKVCFTFSYKIAVSPLGYRYSRRKIFGREKFFSFNSTKIEN